MQYCIQAADTDEPVTPLFSVPEFQQRLLRFHGESEDRRDDDRDEVLYVLEGTAVASIGGETQALEPGTGFFVARGTPWHVESVDGLLLLSVLVEDPLPATASHAVIAGGDRGAATAGREFTLLAHPVLPEQVGIRLHCWMQGLADRRTRLLRRRGTHYVVLTRAD